MLIKIPAFYPQLRPVCQTDRKCVLLLQRSIAVGNDDTFDDFSANELCVTPTSRKNITLETNRVAYTGVACTIETIFFDHSFSCRLV